MQASTSSSRMSSGTAMTAASSTSGCVSSQAFDLGRGDVFARAADDVLAPLHEVQHA
jgi:hypothetical protein